jgi:hypothetical protein
MGHLKSQKAKPYGSPLQGIKPKEHFSLLKWPQAKVMGISLKTENEE